MRSLLNGGLRGVGQDQIAGATGLVNQNQAQWPYFWTEPGPDAQYVQRVASIPAPGPIPPGQTTNQVLVLELDVPQGFVFVLRAILQTYQTNTGSVFTNGSGDILWTVDVNIPVGVPTLGGYGLPDMTNMAEQRGSFINGPWQVEGHTIFQPNDQIRYKVSTNTANIAPGAPNFISCGFFGWFEKALQ